MGTRPITLTISTDYSVFQRLTPTQAKYLMQGGSMGARIWIPKQTAAVLVRRGLMIQPEYCEGLYVHTLAGWYMHQAMHAIADTAAERKRMDKIEKGVTPHVLDTIGFNLSRIRDEANRIVCELREQGLYNDT